MLTYIFVVMVASICSIQSAAEAGIALTILCAFCFIPAGYTIYLINERVNREKHMQSVYGVGVLCYWNTALLWDMVSAQYHSNCKTHFGT